MIVLSLQWILLSGSIFLSLVVNQLPDSLPDLFILFIYISVNIYCYNAVTFKVNNVKECNLSNEYLS